MVNGGTDGRRMMIEAGRLEGREPPLPSSRARSPTTRFGLQREDRVRDARLPDPSASANPVAGKLVPLP